MLEIARLIVDSGWVPYRPVIFLFNGAEELFMLVGSFSIENNALFMSGFYDNETNGCVVYF